MATTHSVNVTADFEFIFGNGAARGPKWKVSGYVDDEWIVAYSYSDDLDTAKRSRFEFGPDAVWERI